MVLSNLTSVVTPTIDTRSFYLYVTESFFVGPPDLGADSLRRVLRPNRYPFVVILGSGRPVPFSPWGQRPLSYVSEFCSGSVSDSFVSSPKYPSSPGVVGSDPGVWPRFTWLETGTQTLPSPWWTSPRPVRGGMSDSCCLRTFSETRTFELRYDGCEGPRTKTNTLVLDTVEDLLCQHIALIILVPLDSH